LRLTLGSAPRLVRIRSKLETLEIGGKGYLRSHWLGQQSLAWSFWVNLVLLRALILFLEDFVRFPSRDGVYHSEIAAIVFFIVAHVVIYIWQIVGVVRCCDRHLSDYWSIMLVWGAYFGIVVSLLFTFVGVWETFQINILKSDEPLLSSIWERERASRYNLSVSGDGTRVNLTGSFELGLTKKLKALLQEHPNVKAVVLSSPGGNIYESRGVAKLMKQHSLNSYVFEACYSACTTAFIAGATRTLGPDGRLGFHSYRIEAAHRHPFSNTVGEQNYDRKLYEAQKIKGEFLNEIFEAPPSELWLPSTEKLLEAGVVHRIEAKVH
jgi:hypothetical protein